MTVSSRATNLSDEGRGACDCVGGEDLGGEGVVDEGRVVGEGTDLGEGTISVRPRPARTSPPAPSDQMQCIRLYTGYAGRSSQLPCSPKALVVQREV